MNARLPPRSATWLLEQVGGSRLEPLLGDLEEQFEDGRSRLWYWRQATGALTIEVVQALRLHAISFIAAIGAGCALIRLLHAGYAYAFEPLNENLSALSRHPWTAQAVLRVAGMEMVGILANAILFVNVWAVIRIHRSHPRAVLSVFVAAVTLPYLPGLARLIVRAATDPRLTAPLVSLHLHLMVPVAWQALCILAAGLWVIQRPQFTAMGRLTYFVAILAASLCVLSGLAHAAGVVGEFTYTLHEQYISDVLNITIVAYLILLLWRSNPTPRITKENLSHIGGG